LQRYGTYQTLPSLHAQGSVHVESRVPGSHDSPV